MGDFNNIADAGKAFACALYKAQPNAIIPNPISDALFHVWDEFCGNGEPPGSLPPPPAPLFQGGQCPVRYEVKCNGVNFNSIDSTGSPAGETIAFPYGPISGVKSVRTGGGSSFSVAHFIVAKSSTGQPQDYGIGGSSGTGAWIWKSYRFITSLKRVDNQPDNCGNSAPGYPETSPPPPGGFTSPPTAITFNNGDTKNYTFNFTPPSPPALPAVVLPPIVINYFRPQINPEINIPLNFNFDGTVNFGTPGGGGGGFGQPDRDIINNINNVNNSNNTNITKINNDLRNTYNITNNKPRDPSTFLPPVTNKPPGKHDKTFLAAVEIQITQVPANAKMQSGNTAPRVLYAGWFEFQRAGKSLPREPIHFDGSVFLAPSGVDGYAFTLYTGYQGVATEIINKEAI